MKTLTMSYGEYLDDLTEARCTAYEKAYREVLDYLDMNGKQSAFTRLHDLKKEGLTATSDAEVAMLERIAEIKMMLHELEIQNKR